MRLDPHREIPSTGRTVGDFWAWVVEGVGRSATIVKHALDCHAHAFITASPDSHLLDCSPEINN